MSFLNTPWSPARTSTSARSRFFSVLSCWIVLYHVSFGLPILVLSTGLHCIACLGIMCSEIPKMCPYCLHQRIFRFLVIEYCPLLHLSFATLTMSYNLIFIFFLRQPFYSLLTRSSCLLYLQWHTPIHQYGEDNALGAGIYNPRPTLSPCWSKAAPALPIPILTSCLVSLSLRTLHSN